MDDIYILSITMPSIFGYCLLGFLPGETLQLYQTKQRRCIQLPSDEHAELCCRPIRLDLLGTQ